MGEAAFTMTEADYVAAHRDWFRSTIGKRKVIVRLAVGATAVFAIGMALAWSDGEGLTGQAIYAACLAAAFIVLVLFCLGLTYALMPRRAGRLFRQQTAMHKPMSVAWSDEGMVHRSANGEGRYAWSDLHRWSTARSAILIYQTDQMFHVVPRRVLTAGQTADLIKTLNEKGPPRL
jgi:hypothetical protein